MRKIWGNPEFFVIKLFYFILLGRRRKNLYIIVIFSVNKGPQYYIR